MTNVRVQLQLAEAIGPDNRWFCSQAHGRPIDDPELLLIYFIRSGGAEDFDFRFKQAMGPVNRWYCSEFHGREIGDPEILWNYYMNYETVRLRGGAMTCSALDESLAF